LVPATIVPKDQLWFHHPSMRKRVSQAEEDLREGRVSRTASPQEAESLLDSLKRSARNKRG
jgi:hypothetical protein